MSNQEHYQKGTGNNRGNYGWIYPILQFYLARTVQFRSNTIHPITSVGWFVDLVRNFVKMVVLVG